GESTLGTSLGVTQIFQLATPLVLAGAAAALAQRVRLWNLGIQGQMVAGSWLGTLIAFAVPAWPPALLVPIVLLGALAGGVGWMVVPALARAYLGVSEVITTLMLNFIAGFWVVYWATGPWAQ